MFAFNEKKTTSEDPPSQGGEPPTGGGETTAEGQIDPPSTVAPAAENRSKRTAKRRRTGPSTVDGASDDELETAEDESPATVRGEKEEIKSGKEEEDEADDERKSLITGAFPSDSETEGEAESSEDEHAKSDFDLKRMNRRLYGGKKVNWRRYPKMLIPGSRGLHYRKDRFKKEEDAKRHSEQNDVGRATFSAEVHRRTGIDQPTWNNARVGSEEYAQMYAKLHEAAEALRNEVEAKRSEAKPVKRGKDFTYSNPESFQFASYLVAQGDYESRLQKLHGEKADKDGESNDNGEKKAESSTTTTTTTTTTSEETGEDKVTKPRRRKAQKKSSTRGRRGPRSKLAVNKETDDAFRDTPWGTTPYLSMSINHRHSGAYAAGSKFGGEHRAERAVKGSAGKQHLFGFTPRQFKKRKMRHVLNEHVSGNINHEHRKLFEDEIDEIGEIPGKNLIGQRAMQVPSEKEEEYGANNQKGEKTQAEKKNEKVRGGMARTADADISEHYEEYAAANDAMIVYPNGIGGFSESRPRHSQEGTPGARELYAKAATAPAEERVKTLESASDMLQHMDTEEGEEAKGEKASGGGGEDEEMLEGGGEGGEVAEGQEPQGQGAVDQEMIDDEQEGGEQRMD